MQISLKKALKARGVVDAYLGSSDLPLKTSLSVFVEANRENPASAVSSATEALVDKLSERVRVSGIFARLRAAIARSNVDAGIETILAEIADIDRQIALYKMVAAAPVTADEEIVKGEIEVAHRILSNAETSRSGFAHGERAIHVSTVSKELQEEAAGRVVELRRLREDAEDRRAAINATQKVEIADEDHGFLVNIGIL